MKTNVLFRRAMHAIGDKATHYNPSHNGEIHEYIDGLINRSNSPRRKELLAKIKDAIIERDVKEVDRLTEVYHELPKKTLNINMGQGKTGTLWTKQN